MTEAPTTRAGRVYGGESAEDRAARRRRQVLDAGLEVFGTVGYRAATVRQICREAKVADRYFYEHFANTEELLTGVYTRCIDLLRAEVLAALGTVVGPGDEDNGDEDNGDEDNGDPLTMARVGIAAFLQVVRDDPRLARVVWFEVLGVSPHVEDVYLGAMSGFAELLLGLVTVYYPLPNPTDASIRVMADAAVGGISHTVMTWTHASFGTDQDVVADGLARFLGGVAIATGAPVA